MLIAVSLKNIGPLCVIITLVVAIRVDPGAKPIRFNIGFTTWPIMPTRILRS